MRVRSEPARAREKQRDSGRKTVAARAHLIRRHNRREEEEEHDEQVPITDEFGTPRVEDAASELLALLNESADVRIAAGIRLALRMPAKRARDDLDRPFLVRVMLSLTVRHVFQVHVLARSRLLEVLVVGAILLDAALLAA